MDRNALPAPSDKPLETQSFVAPSSDVEAQIAAIWARVLGVEKVGAKDNFFALGGHSLLAVQAHREIRPTGQRRTQRQAEAQAEQMAGPVTGQHANLLDQYWRNAPNR